MHHTSHCLILLHFTLENIHLQYPECSVANATTEAKRRLKDGILLAGNYDTYLQVRSELEDAQAKKHKWEQDQISHMKVGAHLFFEPQVAGFCLQTAD